MKPWVKGTSEGRLYVDTKHPEWKKWFVEQIEKYSKLNILKKAPPMSGEQKEPTDEEIERSFNEAANQLISNAAVRARYVRKEKYEAVLKSLGELIPIAERHHKYFSSWLGWLDENGRDDETGEKPDWVDRLPIYKAAIEHAKKLLDKQPQSESDGDKDLSD